MQGIRSIIAAILLAVVLAGPISAQALRPQILILGSTHFGETGDYTGGSGIDILQESRQQEVEEIVRRLEEFRPTRIVVEVPAEMDSAYRSRYELYRGGNAELRRSESEQIGFRLARRLGHPRVYAIDARVEEDLPGVIRWASENGDTSFLNLVQEFSVRMRAENAEDANRPLLEVFRRVNSPEHDALHWAYLRMARVGSEAGYVGASVVASRYERNLRIFANLTRIAGPGDRVLVIYGSSHGKYLRDFVREADDLDLVDIEPYLSPPPANSRRP